MPWHASRYTETLVQEGRIELRNFGVFEVKKRKPRQARNRRTGENVAVPQRAVPKPSTSFPSAVRISDQLLVADAQAAGHGPPLVAYTQ